MDNLIPALIVGFIFFLVYVSVTRWIFKIDYFADYQRKQYLMLRQIAKASGVDAMSILEIDDYSAFTKKKKELAKAEKTTAGKA